MQKYKVSFKGQNIYVGIDVHLKTWHVTTLTETGCKYSFAQHADAKELFDRHQRSEIIDRLGKATAKYDDWPCFLEIMRLELTALIFVTTRPLPSKL